MGPVRKLISSCSKEREAAFWNMPSSYEHCSGSCSKSSGRQQPIGMRLNEILRFLKVFGTGTTYSIQHQFNKYTVFL